MHFSSVALATIAAISPIASAHMGGAPQLVGLNIADLKTRDLLSRLGAGGVSVAAAHNHVELEAREDKPNCGAGIGSCPTGKCCSIAGFCGTTDAHCRAPGCQYEFGPACPENNPPSGTNTTSVSREKLGNVTYSGDGLFVCKEKGMVAITYDDGPMKDFTTTILDLFKKYNGKATFFITGANQAKGQIDQTDEYISVIKRMDEEGHQIASHTFTHLDLSKISSKLRKDQMVLNEMAIRNIVGKIPTYMRPPFSSCTKDSGCQKDMEDLGYHITNFKINTDDYEQAPKNTFQNSLDWFKSNVTAPGANPTNSSFISISHDIIEKTASELTEFMLKTVTELGYKVVTVGECLGDPKENWYRKADGAGAIGTSTRKNLTEIAANASASGTSGPAATGTSSNSPQQSTNAAAVTGVSFVAGSVLLTIAQALFF